MDIFQAASIGDCAQISKLECQGITVDKAGQTPFHYAAKLGSIQAVNALLQRGSHVLIADKTGKTPLFAAVAAGNFEMTTTLLNQQTGMYDDAADQDGNTALIIAAQNGHDRIVELLLSTGADPNRCTVQSRYSALLLASTGRINSSENAPMCSCATVKALLDAGANPHHKANNGLGCGERTSSVLVQRLIAAYKQGPSWLLRELSARGLDCELVFDTEDKLTTAQLHCQHAFRARPHTEFDVAHLAELHITDPLACCAVLNLRLQCTWLGARLTSLGVSSCWLGVCEVAVFVTIGSATEVGFAQVQPQELADECLIEMGLASGFVRQSLRAVHAQLCATAIGEGESAGEGEGEGEGEGVKAATKKQRIK